MSLGTIKLIFIFWETYCCQEPHKNLINTYHVLETVFYEPQHTNLFTILKGKSFSKKTHSNLLNSYGAFMNFALRSTFCTYCSFLHSLAWYLYLYPNIMSLLYSLLLPVNRSSNRSTFWSPSFPSAFSPKCLSIFLFSPPALYSNLSFLIFYRWYKIIVGLICKCTWLFLYTIVS